ncbi:MAG: phosphate acyltransferase PlsX [Chloroflexi bacterium]|nr:phosphate acyltransferase PlsX [Chloroflexota bacterium]
MRIALDAMGSDNAPVVDVAGGLRAARRYDCELILVGDEARIQTELAKADLAGLQVRVVHATQVIEMGEHPAEAVRAKTDSSIVVGLKLVRDGQADAFVSAGNSGGTLAAAIASVGRVGRITGVHRPAISSVVPTTGAPTILADIGANTDCRPEWIVQFGIMAAAYAETLGITNPRVGLLSNGEEDTKGNAAVQTAHQLMKKLPLNFVGNVEGRDILQGAADVIACDGFVGNVALKTAEGVISVILSSLRSTIKARTITSIGGLLAKPAFREVGRKLDYREFGGAPLLGVNGVVIIAHGRSDELAIENAVRVAIRCVENGLVAQVQRAIKDSAPVLSSLLDTSDPTGA